MEILPDVRHWHLSCNAISIMLVLIMLCYICIYVKPNHDGDNVTNGDIFVAMDGFRLSFLQ